MRTNLILRPLFFGAIAALAACSGTAGITTADSKVTADSTIVLALAPANATTGVDLARPIVVTFNRPMMAGMETLVLVHEGSVTGPVVAGPSTWSIDRTVLTFTPATPLKSHTTYVVHLSPSILGANGHPLDLAACARLGGQSVTSGMMGTATGSGMMGGSWGPGMMGNGWRAADGTFGMVFTFTTA
jgi:hypothetical protein